MKKFFLISILSLFSISALAKTTIETEEKCQIRELSWIGIGTLIVLEHKLDLNTTLPLKLDLATMQKSVTLQQIEVEDELSRAVKIAVTDKISNKTENAKNEITVGDRFGLSVSVSCSPDYTEVN